MRRTHFQDHDEIVAAVLGLRTLFASWGLDDRSWMLGKHVSLYLAGVFSDPTAIARDVSAYVLRDQISWIQSDAGRSVVPTQGTTAANDYHAFEAEHELGLDVTPLPDDYSTAAFITEPAFIDVAGQLINVETLKKYVDRRIAICRTQQDFSPDEIREFYFANHDRYTRRLAEFQHLASWAADHDASLIPRIDELIERYDALIHRAYPELFVSQLASGDVAAGFVASGTGTIEGEVYLVDPQVEPPADRILVFSHFGPRDNPLARHARAIVTDGGGKLSHAAILCRELGVPCIVGARTATQLFATGDRVKLDFESGTVRRIAA